MFRRILLWLLWFFGARPPPNLRCWAMIYRPHTLEPTAAAPDADISGPVTGIGSH